VNSSKWWMCALAALFLLAGSYLVAQDDAVGDPAGRERKAKRAARREGKKARGDRAARRRPSSPQALFDYAGIAAELGLAKPQAEKLTGLILNQQMLAELRRAKLEDAQKDSLKRLCLAAAKDVLAAEDPATKDLALKTLSEKISKDVLTDEQRQRAGRRRGREAGAAKETRAKRDRGGERKRGRKKGGAADSSM